MPKKKSDVSVEITPDKQLESLLGWCITGHHTECPYQISYGKCSCNCHIVENSIGAESAAA